MESLVEILGWGSPIGTGVFIVSIAASLFLLAGTLHTLSKIDKEQNTKK